MPFWAKHLGRTQLTAFQASERSGVLHCRLAGDRVILEGAQKVKPGAKVVPKDVQVPEAAAHEAGAAPPGT